MKPDTSESLARALLAGAGLDHGIDNPQLVETHISWLVLSGEFAYKIKKPLDLGFLDFSTIEKRKHYCEEELRLNRRTAPGIYLDVLAVSGSPTSPQLGDTSNPFEYLIRMRRFDDDATLDRLATRDQLDEPAIFALADAVAHFHQSLETSLPPGNYGTPAQVLEPVLDNFSTLTRLLPESDQPTLQTLKAWSQAEFIRHRKHFQDRYSSGFTRECHGDLHLGNILYDDGKCLLFDCIEFNASLRWTDVAADIAFTIMDIESFDYPGLAHLLLNEYLQHTGDYAALPVLNYYLAYRAMVRAKVSAIRSAQDDCDTAEFLTECRRYLSLTEGYSKPREPFLLIMSGLSGTGKTTVARRLAADLGAIHIRSDVERKRLFGLGIHDSSHDQQMDIYTTSANSRTFDRLAEISQHCLSHTYPVVVDATFLEHSLRSRFADLAIAAGVPWAIVECTAPGSVVSQRLANRVGDASEAGEAQYHAQAALQEAFDDNEQRHVHRIDTTDLTAIEALPRQLRSMLATTLI